MIGKISNLMRGTD